MLRSDEHPKPDEEEEECLHVGDVLENKDDDVDTGVTLKRDTGCQCDPDPLLLENQKLKLEIMRLRDTRLSVDKIKDDDAITEFYTGLPSFAVFLWLFNYLAPKLEKMVYWRGSLATPEERSRARRSMALEPINQFLATLTRLKVGLYIQDMTERFGVSVGALSQYFTTWVCLLHRELKDLNHLLPLMLFRELCQLAISLKNLRVILDCTEIFIQKSNSLINQNQSFSHYKHRTTLIFTGITPSGVISFVSEGFDGKISDRQMIERSPLLERGMLLWQSRASLSGIY